MCVLSPKCCLMFVCVVGSWTVKLQHKWTSSHRASVTHTHTYNYLYSYTTVALSDDDDWRGGDDLMHLPTLIEMEPVHVHHDRDASPELADPARLARVFPPAQPAGQPFGLQFIDCSRLMRIDVDGEFFGRDTTGTGTCDDTDTIMSDNRCFKKSRSE